MQQQNDSDYRRLVSQALVAILLPSEDLQNPCLFALVSETLADLILGAFIGGRLCEPCFIYESLRNAFEVLQARLGTPGWIADPQLDQDKDRLRRFGLLREHDQPNQSFDKSSKPRYVQDYFWGSIKYVLLGIELLWKVMMVLLFAPSLPSRQSVDAACTSKASADYSIANPESFAGGTHVQKKALHLTSTKKTPIVSCKIWAALSSLLALQQRTPWFHGACSLLRHIALAGPGRTGTTDGLLDR